MRKRQLMIPIIVFTLVMMIAVSVILVNLIRDFEARQMKMMSENIVELLKDGLIRTLSQREMVDPSSISREGVLDKMFDASSLFRESGEFTYENIFGRDPDFAGFSRLIEQFGTDSHFFINLLSDEGLIFASSKREIIGSRIFEEKPSSRLKVTQFLADQTRSDRLLLFDPVNDDSELVIVFPLSNYSNRSGAEEVKVAVVFSGLNIFRNAIEKRVHIPGGRLFLLDGDGNIYGREKGLSDRQNDAERRFEGELANILKKGAPDAVVLSDPYRNPEGIRVNATGIWVDLLDMGIVVEIPVSEVIAPWGYMTFLILSIVITSFLFFLILLISFDRFRIRAYDSNPLTHLPGNLAIQKEIAGALKKKGRMVIYCDLDNFKAFNDAYGFSAGDDVIAFSAELLVRHYGSGKKVFIGHVGGDDFVVIGKHVFLEKQAEKFGEDFDHSIRRFYNEEDREKGYIVSEDRRGEVNKFPFVAMSMGAVYLEPYEKVHPLKIAEICSEVKKEAKKVDGSKLVIDRRRVP